MMTALIGTAGLLGAYASCWFRSWELATSHPMGMVVVLLIRGVSLALVGLLTWGMWRFRRWALWMTQGVAVVTLLQGLALFGRYDKSIGPGWESFWLRVGPDAHYMSARTAWTMIVFALFAAMWACYFARPSVRAWFQRQR